MRLDCNYYIYDDVDEAILIEYATLFEPEPSFEQACNIFNRNTGYQVFDCREDSNHQFTNVEAQNSQDFYDEALTYEEVEAREEYLKIYNV